MTNQRPVVCFEVLTYTQLLAETQPALPPRPGLPLRQDYEYRREGTRNLFLACEHLKRGGDRWRSRSGARCKTSPGRCAGWLNEAYPEAEVIRVVLDNLNTHRTASLYETFPAEEARRIRQAAGVSLHAQARQLVEHGRRLSSASCFPLMPEAAARPERRPSGRKSMLWSQSATPPKTPSTGGSTLPERTNQTSPPLPFRFYG